MSIQASEPLANSTAKSDFNTSLSFLSRTNPEAFTTKPRSGGIIPSLRDVVFEKRPEEDEVAKRRRGEEERRNLLEEKQSRECRLLTAFEESASIISADVKPEMPNTLDDSLLMLAVTISTVTLLAQNSANIPTNHMDWAVKYLTCVRDEQGYHPPNVQGILDQIAERSAKKISTASHVDFAEDQTAEAAPPEGGEGGEGGEAEGGEEAEGAEGGEGAEGAEAEGEGPVTVVSTTRVKIGSSAGEEGGEEAPAAEAAPAEEEEVK